MINQIFPFFSLAFLFNLLKFIIATICQYFLPGLVILSNTNLSKKEKTSLAIVLGLVLSTSLSYLISWLNLDWLLYLYIAFFLIIFIKNQQRYLKIINFKFGLKNFSKIIILIGSINQLIAVFGSGFKTRKGVFYYWINANDGIFHLSLIRSLIKSFPPLQPGAWPLKIDNYHFFSHIAMADLAKIWSLPINHLYFHFFPLLITILMPLILYLLIKKFTKSQFSADFTLFLHFFAADMSYLVAWLLHKKFIFAGDSIDNGAIQFINMPQAFAKLVFFAGILLLSQFIRKKNKLAAYLSVILFSSLVGFKIYFGMFAALGMSLVVFFNFISKIISKKSKKTNLFVWIKLLILQAGLSALYFFPINKNSGGLFWAPLNWVKLYFSPEKLNWQDWFLRMQVYESTNNVKNIIFWNSLAVILFLLAVFGVRLIGALLVFIKNKNLKAKEFIFLYIPSFIFVFLGLNTLQISGGHNVFNFFVVALTVLSILTPLVLEEVSKKLPKLLKLSLILLLIALILPRNIKTNAYFLKKYQEKNDGYLFDNQELEALKFIENNLADKAIIQPSLDNPLSQETPYLLFFTNHYAYYSGKVILESHNQPVKGREEKIKKAFSANNRAEELKKLGIDYFYQFKNARNKQVLPESNIIFSNSRVIIYQVR